MSICEHRITEDSTDFEKVFLKIYDGNLWTALDKMKGWQPPKPLVVVPQIVADYIETQKDNNYNGNASLIVKHYDYFKDEGNDSELNIWIANNFNDFLEAIVNGYTVEKEKKYILKHIDLSEQCKNESVYLSRNRYAKLLHEKYSKDVDMSKIKECHFTQTEIDKLNIGSYVKIRVEP